MTVLPNAPIDAATGLPVPTIAVATDGGVSVIKDDGTVVDAPDASNLHSHFTYFTSDDEVLSGLYYQSSPYNYSQAARYYIPSSDKAGWNNDATVRYDYNGYGNLYPYPNANSGWQLKALATSENRDYLGSTELLTLVDLEESDPQNNSLVAYTTSTYNTGWMNGDIKLATLSDTDDTDVTGSELVTNGDMSSSTGWTLTANYSITGGKLVASNTQANETAYPTISTVAGKTYVATIQVDSISAGAWRLYHRDGSGTWGDYVDLSVGENNITFTAISSTTTLRVYSLSNGGSATFDNLTCRLAEEDRSVNGNGLQVFGSITKNPVNTGADLVAYSGFSASNYLAQPHNSDIDVGTGDFSFTIWAKADAFNSYNVLFSNWWLNNSSAAQFTLETIGTKIWFYVVDGGQFHAAGGNTDLSVGVWNQITVTRKNSLMTVYINGVPESTTYRFTGDLLARTSPLAIGVLWSNTGPSGGAEGAWNGSLALLRMSATAPSPEQIAKIYEDEKHLFTEGAQATLYGTSDAVTALAYDDSTELLHVGTSEGRSVFQGLRRVDNTTTAVGAAISASNNLVAED
jgi:hypothetical protein